MLSRFVRPGDCAVDATCGNGADTLLLARLTGPDGRVWAFDIQDAAIERTTQVLENAGLLQQVTVHNSGHENLTEHVDGPVAAVVFNLGYLPGGDRSVITRPGSTLAGFAQAIELLAPGGIVAITVYPGHEGGEPERAAVDEWAASLTQNMFHVWHMGQSNASPDAPYFILIQRAS
jgi:predicted methyltransferase